MKIAVKTLKEIEESLVKDQGGAFRVLLEKLMPSAGDAYAPESDPFRSHLGASIIGRECPREVWYTWHWTTKSSFSGRMLRLFNRGHLEEPRMVALLLMIGVEVWQVDENGSQFRISDCGGHFGGSKDAVLRGVPDFPELEVGLGEFKTHNAKSFALLVKSGVQSSKWEHYVQMQIYMGKNHFLHGLYMAVNKDTDELHAEIVDYDADTYNRYIYRAADIVNAQEAPMKISTNPTWFKCKFCDHKEVCHGSGLPERNCRTCVHSTAIVEGGKWVCENGEKYGSVIPKEIQLVGCGGYAMNPSMKTPL